MVLVTGTIIISLFLVAISLWLYNTSGAAQLDLSRPGYKSVRSQVTYDDTFTGFPSSGPLDDQALEKFRELYNNQIKEIKAIKGFSGDVLSNSVLGIENPEVQTSSPVE